MSTPPHGADTVLGNAGESHVVTLELGSLAASPVDALNEAEARWFAPLEDALARGRLDRLDLWLAGRTLTSAPRDRLRVWRRAAP